MVVTMVLLAGAMIASPVSTRAAEVSTPATLHFAVTLPGGDSCDIVGDLYLPEGANSEARVPAVMMTNGFGGSKDGLAALARMFADRGYAALAYSGLGFGGSTCPISLNDPERDGAAAAQLVSFLGGASGVAFLDAAHTLPAPEVTVVALDAVGRDGVERANDPRVGMIGGSYGGAVQLAAASVDQRIDAIAPMNTWNDLAYSLFPNSTAQTAGVSSATPGAMKLHWAAGLGAAGMLTGTGKDADPLALLGCNRFVNEVCRALLNGVVLGYPTAADMTALHRLSPSSYLGSVTAPTLLIQGQRDTLFNLNEAIATYETLKAQGTPVSMVWQYGGHTQGPADGEIDEAAPDPASQYVLGRITDWLDHHLLDSTIDAGPEFAYFRDWVAYTGNAAAAYASADSAPTGSRAYYLSGSGALVLDPAAITVGSRAFATAPVGLPTSLDPLDVLGGLLEPTGLSDAEADLPGTALSWTTAPVSAPMELVGSPSLQLKVTAPRARLMQSTGTAGRLVVFAKVLDVAPDGTVSTIADQTAPARVPDVTRPFTVRLPAIVHRVEPGHRLRLVVAAGSVNYRGGLLSDVVAIHTGDTGQVLSLPLLPTG